MSQNTWIGGYGTEARDAAAGRVVARRVVGGEVGSERRQLRRWDPCEREGWSGSCILSFSVPCV
eukprot:6517543-Pyramimonas_sp.AAC.1